MKLSRHINIIFSFLGSVISITVQFQYYNGEKFLSSRHWGIGPGLYFPPSIILLKEEDI